MIFFPWINHKPIHEHLHREKTPCASHILSRNAVATIGLSGVHALPCIFANLVAAIDGVIFGPREVHATSGN